MLITQAEWHNHKLLLPNVSSKSSLLRFSPLPACSQEPGPTLYSTGSWLVCPKFVYEWQGVDIRLGDSIQTMIDHTEPCVSIRAMGLKPLSHGPINNTGQIRIQPRCDANGSGSKPVCFLKDIFSSAIGK